MHTLTASELIEALQKLPPNKPVIVEYQALKHSVIRKEYQWVSRGIESVDPGYGQRNGSIVAIGD